jgi:hypothetical protein
MTMKMLGNKVSLKALAQEFAKGIIAQHPMGGRPCQLSNSFMLK